MQYEKDAIYHIYNRANEILFYSHANYLFFLKSIRRYILPYTDILAYCLMPNHFHLLLRVNDVGVLPWKTQKLALQNFSYYLGNMLSAYTKAINKQQGRRGSLFAHNTKAKQINGNKGYGLNCFAYIHNNPVEAKLVKDIKDWKFSSYPDYVGLRNGSLVNQELMLEILNIERKDIAYITKLLGGKMDDEVFI